MKSNDQGATKILNNLKGSFDNNELFKTMYSVFVEKNILKEKGLFNSANINIYSATKFCGDLIKQVLSSNDSQAKQHIYDIFNNCIKIICLVKTGSALYPSGNDTIRNVDSQNTNPSETALNYALSCRAWFSENFAYSKNMKATAGLQSTYKKIGLEYDDFVDCVQCIFRNLLVNVLDNINQCPVGNNDNDKGLKDILKSMVELFCDVIVDIRLKDLTAKPNYKQGLEYKDICIVLDTINKCFPEELKQKDGEELAQQQNVREELMQYFFGLFDLVTEFVIYRKEGFGGVSDIIATLAELTPSSNIIDAAVRKTFTVLKAGYNFLTGNLTLTKEDILPDEVVNKIKTEQTKNKNKNKSDAGNVLFDIKNGGVNPGFEWADFINDVFLGATSSKPVATRKENFDKLLDVLYSNENEFLFDLNSWLKKLDGQMFWLIEYFLKLGTNAMAAKFPDDFSLKKVNKLNPADELFVPDKNLANDRKKKGDIVIQSLCMNENLRKIYFTFETQMLNKCLYKDSLEKLMIRTLSEKFGSIFNVLTELQKSIQNREKYPNKLSAVVSFVLENFPPKKILEYITRNSNRKRKIWHVKTYIVCGFAIAKMISPDINNQKSELTRCFKTFALEFVGDNDFEKILIHQDISNKKNIKNELNELINNIYELPLKDCCSVFLLDHLNENKYLDGAYITKVVNRLKQLNEKSTTPKEKLEALRKVEAENQNNNNDYSEKVKKDENEKQDTGENKEIRKKDDELNKVESNAINNERAISKFEVKREIREKPETLDQIENKFPIGRRSPSTYSNTNKDEAPPDNDSFYSVSESDNDYLFCMGPKPENNDNNNGDVNLKSDNIDSKENVEVKEKLDQVNVNLNLFVNKDRKGESFNSTQKNDDKNKKVKKGEEKNSNPNPNVNVNEITNNLKKYNPDEAGEIGISKKKEADTETENAIENTSSVEKSKKEGLSQSKYIKYRVQVVLLGVLAFAGFIVLAGIGLTILWMALITAITSVSTTLTQLLIVVGEVFLGGGLLGLAAYVEYKFIEHVNNIWRNLANKKPSLEKNTFTNINGHSELSMSDKIDRVQENNSRQYNNADNIDKIKMEKKNKDMNQKIS